MFISRLLRCCLLLVGLFGATTGFSQEKLKATPTAKAHFASGLAHIDDPAGPKYEEAYQEFRAAYAETPAFEIAVNIAYCAFFLERDAEALQMYELYLAKATDRDITKKKRLQMERDVHSLRTGLVSVTVKVTPSKATLIDERFPSKGSNVINRYSIDGGAVQLGIHPGTHKFTIAAEGYQSLAWEFNAAPGSSHDHEFALASTNSAQSSDTEIQPPAVAPLPAYGRTTTVNLTSEQHTRSVPTVVYVGAIATGVFTAGAVGMGLFTSSKRSDFDAANDGMQVTKAEGLRDDVRTYALVTDVFLGAAVLSAGATIFLYLTRDTHGAVVPPASAWRLSPAVGKSTTSIAVSGRF